MSNMPSQNRFSSKQSVGTPKELIQAIEKRFGPIVLDLAAHAANHIVERYFAPAALEVIYDPNPKHKRDNLDDLITELVEAGGNLIEAQRAVWAAFETKTKTIVSIINRDDKHGGLNSLTQPWAFALDGRLVFLNPEFNNIDPWAEKCFEEAKKGAKIVLLTPLTVANWADKYCHGKGLVLGLNPRLVFQGHKDAYPKDVMLICYNLGPNEFEVWKWKN